MGHFEHYILMDGKLSKRSNRAETYCLYKGPSKISSMVARRDILIGSARVMISFPAILFSYLKVPQYTNNFINNIHLLFIVNAFEMCRTVLNILVSCICYIMMPNYELLRLLIVYIYELPLTVIRYIYSLCNELSL